MRVLIGCEESATVRDAFRLRGHDAWSCDLLKSRGSNNYHMQCDVLQAIDDRPWDLIILHPDCTKMAVSGNRWYGKGSGRYAERVAAIEQTQRLWYRATDVCDKVVLENPVSVIFPAIRWCCDDVQYIQPWQFGHGETKKTGLALKGVSRLVPTNVVEGREQRIWRMAPHKDRKRDRSKTYQGIADAMAEQWGGDHAL